jgi:hypothetical protein
MIKRLKSTLLKEANAKIKPSKSKAPRLPFNKKPAHFLPFINSDLMSNSTFTDRQSRPMTIFSRKPSPILSRKKIKIMLSLVKSID